MPNKQTSVLKRFVAFLMSGFNLFAKAFHATYHQICGVGNSAGIGNDTLCHCTLYSRTFGQSWLQLLGCLGVDLREVCGRPSRHCISSSYGIGASHWNLGGGIGHRHLCCSCRSQIDGKGYCCLRGTLRNTLCGGGRWVWFSMHSKVGALSVEEEKCGLSSST